MKQARPLLASLLISFSAGTSASDLQVTSLGKEYQPGPHRVVIQQTEANLGGNTSVRNTDRSHLEWKTQGYFQRNRDLGQVFTANRAFLLRAIVLRTGPGDGAVLAGSPGATVFVQFFAVQGSPAIHDNATPAGTESKHGFSQNHRCDDYIKGVDYRPIQLIRGGTFPSLSPTRDLKGEANGDKQGCLTYLRWQFRDPIIIESGKRYAFMVGFEDPGLERGFTLANANAAGVDAPPSLTDTHDRYHGGWSIRREGDGTLPPTMVPGTTPPRAEAILAQLYREALFREGPARFALSPTTDGFPDVDTYRDLEFYLESSLD